MALEKGTEEFQFFGELFQLCKKYWNVQNTEQYWQNLLDECGVMSKKYESIPLARKFIVAFIGEQERKCKKQ